MGKLIVYLQTFVLLIYVCLQTLIGKFMILLFPETVKKLVLKAGLKTTMTQNPKFKYEDWGPTLFSLRFVKAVVEHLLMNIGDEAFKGTSAPNTRVIDFDNKEHKVLDFLKDGWTFKNNVEIKKHQTLSDRINAARMLLKEEPPCPVVVDSMDDMTGIKYGAMPERLYVVLDGKIIYKGNMGPWGYQPEEVRLILQNQS